MTANTSHQTFLRPGETMITIQGLAGRCEAIYYRHPSARRCALILHPHPTRGGGGSMTNKVVTALHQSCQEQESTLRINTRGVGKSEGVFADFSGALCDAISAIHWIQQQSYEVGTLAGFSFGAALAYRLATLTTYRQLIMIAPPVHYACFSTPPHLNPQLVQQVPHTVVIGQDDDIVSPGDVLDWQSNTYPEITMLTLPDCGHFFHGQLSQLKRSLGQRPAP